MTLNKIRERAAAIYRLSLHEQGGNLRTMIAREALAIISDLDAREWEEAEQDAETADFTEYLGTTKIPSHLSDDGCYDPADGTDAS